LEKKLARIEWTVSIIANAAGLILFAVLAFGMFFLGVTQGHNPFYSGLIAVAVGGMVAWANVYEGLRSIDKLRKKDEGE
jgi:hypothetical protein